MESLVVGLQLPVVREEICRRSDGRLARRRGEATLHSSNTVETPYRLARPETAVVDSRTTSSGSTITRAGCISVPGRAIRRNTVSAAIMPIFRKGCRTVVSAGF